MIDWFQTLLFKFNLRRYSKARAGGCDADHCDWTTCVDDVGRGGYIKKKNGVFRLELADDVGTAACQIMPATSSTRILPPRFLR